MEEGHEPPHDPTTERELAEEAEDARNRAPRVDEQREIPLAMPEPGDFIPSPSGHSAPTPGQFPHLNLDTDTESEGSGPGDEADDSDASTRATTAPPLDTHKQRSPGLDTVTKAPPLDASKSDKSELRKADDAGASNKATITPPSDAPNGKNSKKGASMRGGAGDYSDAEEYDFHEAYDDEYTNRDRTPPPHNRTPRDNSSHASHTHTYTSHHTHPSQPPR